MLVLVYDFGELRQTRVAPNQPKGTWWIETTQGEFAAQVDTGLREAGSSPQAWRIGNMHVSQFDELRPKGEWHWLSVP